MPRTYVPFAVLTELGEPCEHMSAQLVACPA